MHPTNFSLFDPLSQLWIIEYKLGDAAKRPILRDNKTADFEIITKQPILERIKMADFRSVAKSTCLATEAHL